MCSDHEKQYKPGHHRSVDLTGKRFGRLEVLQEAELPYFAQGGKPTRQWVCRCDCGKIITVRQNALTRKNPQQSCGCLQREMLSKVGIDLTGQRFGRLVVVKKVKADKPQANRIKSTWLCKCDCGKETIASTKDLRQSGVKSCGCLLRETATQKTTEQNVFGHRYGTNISILKSDKPRSNNKSGVRGVYWNDRECQWIASITVCGKNIKKRCGKNIEDAIKMRQQLFEEYALPIIQK